MTAADANDVLAALWRAAEQPAAAMDAIELTGAEPALPSSFAVGTAAPSGRIRQPRRTDPRTTGGNHVRAGPVAARVNHSFGSAARTCACGSPSSRRTILVPSTRATHF